MKKICILQNSINYGGTDTFVINLCKGLIKDGYIVKVVLSVDKDNIGRKIYDLEDTGADIVWTCSPKNINSKIKHFILLYRELKKEKFDVFQTNIDLFNGPNLFVSWLARIPVRVCHSHNSQQGLELRKGRTVIVRLYQGIMRWLCWQFSNRRCGCSESALTFLFKNKWMKDKNSYVIPNGIDLSVYQRKININNKKKELNLNNKFNICTVGRISYQKNPEFLLEIFYELTKMRNDVDLIWCGSGELETLIKEKLIFFHLEDKVHLLGTRNDIPEILKCSDIFLLPSRFEGLGIVLIEAQAVELPCVISDVIPIEVDCGLCQNISLDCSATYWAKQISEILDKKKVFELNEMKLKQYGIEYMVKMMEEVFE